MRFGSVCSGIEAASVAWEPLGWRAAWLSEIEAFPSAVLAHHWPDVPNMGNMLRLPAMVASGEIEAPDVLVGGTPCQAFSVAGKRGSLEDERGALTLAFVELANEIDSRRAANGLRSAVVVWENVPGVLSTKDNAFGCFLAGLAGEDQPLFPAGPRWSNAGCVFGPARTVAWRVLDAQYFGVAQRRRRVFVVASARDGFDPATVLFEFDGLRRDTAPGREAGQVAAANAGSGAAFGGGRTSGPLDVAACLVAKGQKLDFEVETFAVCATGDIAHTLKAEDFDGGEDGTGRGVPTIAVHGTQDPCVGVEVSFAQGRNNGGENAVLVPAMAVRRLTPRECERLQGFPDNHTLVPHRCKPAADGPRYKALGNSMAVPVMRWIGARIHQQVCADQWGGYAVREFAA